MNRVVDMSRLELNAILQKLEGAGVTVKDMYWMLDGNNASIVAESIRNARNHNPFEQSVDEQLTALRKQNNEGNWRIPEEVFDRLAKTAPAWPAGRDAYRSLRIRFGEGDEGVALTFERHVEAVKRVDDLNFWRVDYLLSGKHPYQGKPVERLRLLNGNQSHKPVVEWIVISDLSANRRRKDITSVRGPKSLADEGIVLAWLNPKRVKAIDHKEWCAWYCAGYEINLPHKSEEWEDVMAVRYDILANKIGLNTDQRSNNNPDSSVPSLG